MTTTLTRPVRPGTPRTGVERPGGTGTPRTSAAHPWDRVRFAGPPVRACGPDEESAPVDEVDLPDPQQWAGALVRSTVEVLCGSRPVAQLARWLAPELFESVSRRAGLAERIQGRPRMAARAIIRRVHVCRIEAGTVEASVVVHDGSHLRAAAVRLEAHRGRWRATALQIG
ncbi:Rv3235 family protein [Georgenia alba]|uniref:Rv3235 family protein n=1 Tax=Georgenia alba TaxID=2233858 RepID=A0ABW2QB82_9MICO